MPQAPMPHTPCLTPCLTPKSPHPPRPAPHAPRAMAPFPAPNAPHPTAHTLPPIPHASHHAPHATRHTPHATRHAPRRAKPRTRARAHARTHALQISILVRRNISRTCTVIHRHAHSGVSERPCGCRLAHHIISSYSWGALPMVTSKHPLDVYARCVSPDLRLVQTGLAGANGGRRQSRCANAHGTGDGSRSGLADRRCLAIDHSAAGERRAKRARHRWSSVQRRSRCAGRNEVRVSRTDMTIGTILVRGWAI